PFFTTKELGKGSGLGLSMVQGFALQSGGAVRLRTSPGAGTNIEIWLPRAAPGPVPSAEGVVAARRSRTGRLLVCDDDPAVREVVANILVDAGYAVVEASSGSAAI